MTDLKLKEIINLISEKEKELKNIYREYLINYDSFVFEESSLFFDSLKIEYEESKNNIKNNFMLNGKNIDRHKITTIFMFILLNKKIFIVRDNIENIKIILLNELFALYCSLSIMHSIYIESEEKTIEFDDYIFPQSNHEDYIAHFIKNIRLSIDNNCFDIITYSNLFFTIESYTIMFYKNEKMKDDVLKKLKEYDIKESIVNEINSILYNPNLPT